MELRYGMNPHQAARLIGPAPFRVVSGRPSMINLMDAAAAWQLVREARIATGVCTAASFKHLSPAGAALAGELDAATRTIWRLDPGEQVDDPTRAYIRARDCDPRASFGDMVAVSDEVTVELARFLARVVSDGIVAPSYAPGSLEILRSKKRGAFLILAVDPSFEPSEWERRDVFGMTIEQQRDGAPITPDLLTVVEGPPLTVGATSDALLGLVAARYTQSNSVVYVRDGMTVGVGSGQQSRIDCTVLAGRKAHTWWLRRDPDILAAEYAPDMTTQQRINAATEATDTVLSAEQRRRWLGRFTDATLVSDGYLPFRDNIDAAHGFGVGCVVEPGGSMRSDDVQQTCSERGMTLVRTGLRLFRH